MAHELVEVRSESELVELIGTPTPRVEATRWPTLHAVHREWLAHSPFCLVATSDAAGRCDVAPKGDVAGFTVVIDDATIALPDRRGVRRIDGFRNVLVNPHVGLLYLVPGRPDSLRLNGRARIVRDGPFFEQMAAEGERPRLALVVDIEEVFFHVTRAFERSAIWQPEAWQPEAVSSRAAIALALEQVDERIEGGLEELDHYYGPQTVDRPYG